MGATPVRSIVDAAEAGTALEQMTAAVRQALERGSTSGNLLKVVRQAEGCVARLIQEQAGVS